MCGKLKDTKCNHRSTMNEVKTKSRVVTTLFCSNVYLHE